MKNGLLLIALMGISSPSPPRPPAVLISAEQLFQLIETKEQLRILDARGSKANAPFIKNAIVTDWKDVRAGWLREGRLAPSKKARTYYAGLGVDIRHPVVVYGAGHHGWGEEGRIWWNLTTLGHPEVYILDGGIEAWLRSKGERTASPFLPPPGYFPKAARTPTSLRLHAQDILSLINEPNSIIVDVRTEAEYHGQTPYLSPRGGHIPRAKHLPWKSLLSEQGTLRPKTQLINLLGELGITLQTSMVATYCTGGVRSAFVTAVLTHLGIRSANYDGSWWDWSTQAHLPISPE